MRQFFLISLRSVLLFSPLSLLGANSYPTFVQGLTLEDGELEGKEDNMIAMTPEEQLKKEGSYEITPDRIPKMPPKKTYSSFQSLVLPIITISLVITGIIVTKINQGQEV